MILHSFSVSLTKRFRKNHILNFELKKRGQDLFKSLDLFLVSLLQSDSRIFHRFYFFTFKALPLVSCKVDDLSWRLAWSKIRAGSNRLPPNDISKCRCSVVARPVRPVSPITCPAFTLSPFFTRFFD